jgi:hypothetical protein
MKKIKLTKTLLEKVAKYDENENLFVYWINTFENQIVDYEQLIQIVLEAWTYKIDNENEPEIAPIAFVLGLKEKQVLLFCSSYVYSWKNGCCCLALTNTLFRN